MKKNRLGHNPRSEQYKNLINGKKTERLLKILDKCPKMFEILMSKKVGLKK